MAEPDIPTALEDTPSGFIPDQNIGKQAIAGLVDALSPSSILGFRSLVRTGIPALLTTNPTGPDYLGRLSESMDKRRDLQDVALSVVDQAFREANNRSLGIGEPETTAEQVARVGAGMLLPIPTPSKATGAGVSLAHVLAPGFAVRSGDVAGNIARGIGNVAVGVGLDQAIRGAAEQKDVGGSGFIPDAQITAPVKSPSPPPTSEFTPDDSALTISAGTDSPTSGFIPASDIESGFTPGTPDEIAAFDPAVRDKLLEDEKMSRAVVRTLTGIGIAATGLALLFRKGRLDMLKREPGSEHAPLGSVEVGKDRGDSVSTKLRGIFTDKNAHLENYLRSAVDETTGKPVLTNEQIRSIVGGVNSDAAGQAMYVYTNRKLGYGLEMPTSMRDWGEARLALPDSERLSLDLGMLASQEATLRVRATMQILADNGNVGAQTLLKSGSIDQMEAFLKAAKKEPISLGMRKIDPATNAPLPTGEKYSNAELDSFISTMRSNAKLSSLADSYSKNLDTVLEYAKRRDYATAGELADLRREHTRGGHLMYVPGRSAIYKQSDAVQRVLDSVGFNANPETDSLLGRAGSWLSRSLKEGIDAPINPHDVGHNYLYRTIDHINRNNTAKSILFNMTGVPASGLKPGERPPLVQNGGRVHYIGTIPANTKVDVRDLIKSSRSLDSTVKDAVLAKGAGTEGLKSFMERTMTVVHRGQEYLFYVPDRTMHSVIETHPRTLGLTVQALRASKNVFTSWTTGLMVRAPVSMLYNYMQIQTNATLRGVPYNPGTAVKGMIKNAAYRSGVAISDALSHSIANDSGMARFAPSIAADLKTRLDRYLPDMLMGIVMRESGGLATNLMAHELDKTIMDIAKMASRTYGQDAVSVASVVRFWNGLKRVMHEGPITGLIDNVLQADSSTVSQADKVRKAVHDSYDIAGDVRRTGSAPFMQGAVAVSPWLSPLIQDIGTLAGAVAAAVKSGRIDRIALAASSIMGPSIMAVLWNSYMGDEYSDYYWNKLTPQQRASFWYVAIPGKPPNQGFVLELSPTWAVLNSVAVEAIDAVTGASNANLYDQTRNGPAARTGRNGRMMMEAIGRYFEISPPPVLMAALATVDMQLSLKPQYDAKSDNPTWAAFRSIGKPTRFDQSSATKEASNTYSALAESILTSLFGIGGQLMTVPVNAASQGFASGGIKQGAEYFGGALKDTMLSPAKFMQPIFPGMFRSNETDEISQVARLKADAIKELNAMFDRSGSGLYSFSKAIPSVGDSLQTIDDPMFSVVAEQLTHAMFSLKMYNEKHAELRNQILDLRSTGKYGIGKDKVPVTYKRRNELIEQTSLAIRDLNATFVTDLTEQERAVNERAEKLLGRPTDFEFETWKPRPNLGAGAFLPAPRQLP